MGSVGRLAIAVGLHLINEAVLLLTHGESELTSACISLAGFCE